MGADACHHCGALLGGGALGVRVAGSEVRVCGAPCRTAALAIAGAGLDAWYAIRAHADAAGAVTADPAFRADLDAWKTPEVAAPHVRSAGRGTAAVTLTVEGMRCAGCAWLVERLLAKAPGVLAATVDFPLGRAEVRFDAGAAALPTLLEALADAGYRATPYSAHAEEAAIEAERRTRLRGLGISALFGMQVMLLSIALHASAHYGGMDAGFERLFRWLAMLLTVPVLVWPGRAFFTGAVTALRERRLTMDVPVALGLSIAFLGSAFATVTGDGAIWFDSVVMFVTLLGGARYLELVARRRSSATVRALARAAPLVAIRVYRSEDGRAGTHGGTPDAREEREARVPAATLHPGDRVRVRPGETVPADGVIRAGESIFDESLLTGESHPVARSSGGRVLAGSINGTGVVEVEVTCAGDATVLGGVLRRAQRAARERPAIALLADRVAAWFIAGVLVLAASVAGAWLLHDPSRAIAVVVSVLVVTCPCALSLATPAAMTAALGALARAGVVATRANAVERLALATHCLADKTGTLSEGRLRLRGVSVAGGLSPEECIETAAALERHAAHPAGSAIAAAAEGGPVHARRRPLPRVEDARAHHGGVEGRIGGLRHAVGSAAFVGGACRLASDAFARDEPASGTGDRSGDDDATSLGTRVYLAREEALLARFDLADTLRPEARELVDGLRARGLETTIASGDSAAPVERTGEALGVARRLAGLSPTDKLEEADRLAARGERVLMLGDGVNDAPALAGAHVSVAMERGAAAAASRADAVLLGDDPLALLAGIDIARRARRIVKQNLAWALAYNLVALPLAALGAVPPWAAAIGMSLSSLAVAANALRLVPRQREEGVPGPAPR